jgi:hypothetical protein
VTRASKCELKLVPLLITSTVVPMQFTQGLPLPPQCVVPFNRLREWVNGQSL